MKKNLFLLLCIAHTIAGTATLSELQNRAKNLNEFPKNSSTNWRNPNYDELYSSLAPGFFTRAIGRQASIMQTLSKLLASVTVQRHQKTGSKNHAEQLIAPIDSELIICGEVSGGFHSLIRILNYLKQEQYLDDSLTLIKPNTYLIFNGNSISRGPYNVESIVTILLLMKQNPNTVFYLKGKQERHNYWANLNFRQELKLRGSSFFKSGIPLKKELTDFFATLPQGLYVTTDQDAKHYIRISPSGRSELIIDESIVAQNMPEEVKNGSSIISLQRKEQVAQSDVLPNVISIIKSEPWIKKHLAKKGLAQMDQDQGATAWGLISTPIEAHKRLLGFTYDAFAIVTVGNPLSQSDIALYNRKSGSDQSFKKVTSFNIKTGISMDEKNKNSTTGHLTIGSSMALVQGVPIMGQRTKRGMSVRLNDENKMGGVHNTLLRSIVYNDNYTPHMTRKNINTLLTRDTAELILLPVGSPTLASYLDYVKNKKAVVLFPITGAPQFRDPELKGIVHFRGTYADEVRALVDYMVTDGAASRFAFFYQDDAYGKGPLKAAHEELERKGIKTWTDVPYQRNSVDFKEQAYKIKKAQPDAIGFFSTGQATRELIRQVGIDFLTNKQLFGISFLGESSFRRFLNKHGLKVLFGAVVPNPQTSDLEIVKEYRAAMDANNYPYDIFSLEAYITTSILVDIMQQIIPPITKEKILQKLEALKEYDFKGLKLTFDPERRDLARYIWLESGDDQEWVQKKIVKPSFKKKEDNARSINTSRSEQFSEGSTGPSS